MTRSLILLCALCLVGNRAYAGLGYPIASTYAASAVIAAHPELAENSIELPARVEAHEPEPALVAGPIEHWPASSAAARVRLHCQSEGVCLPFYVLVHPSKKEADSGARSEPPIAPAKTGGLNREDTAALRTGQRASMLIDSGFLHLRIPVTCLQGGAVGSTIRVAGPGRSRVYEAAVVDGTTVRGSL